MKIDLTHLLDIEIIIAHKKLLVKYQLWFRCSTVNCYASMYEEARSTQRIKSATTKPDYKDIKDGLKKRKSRKFKF